MLTSFLLMTLIAQKPLNVSVGDPVLDLKLTNLETGETLPLEALMIDGFCIFLSPTCPKCEEAFENLNVITEEFHYVLIFTGDKETIKNFVKDKGYPPENIYTVTQKQLDRYDINTVPAVVAYKDNKVRVAMHGPLNLKNVSRLRMFLAK